MCHAQHEIDKYGWIQTCFGYFELANVIYEFEKWVKEQVAKLEKNKTKN